MSIGQKIIKKIKKKNKKIGDNAVNQIIKNKIKAELPWTFVVKKQSCCEAL